ncbi:hypothetical protein OXV57_05550 [Bacteroides fragilis]|nr:hypothetical protein [Bacteroides fragilis]
MDDTFQQNGEDGSHVAEGLSGSGVYVIINNKPYLIGILCSVKDTQAWNDDIDCCALSKCLSNISCQMEDLSDLNHIKAWSENLEREKAQEDIDNYKSLNIEFFENLLRKNMVIHDTQEKAINVTNKELKKYLSLKENVSLLESQYPYIYKRFQNVVKKFQDDVEDQYSRSVRDNNEAKDKRLELKDKLKEELENILETGDMKNDGIKFDLADYQVIEWLLDCSLNFTRKIMIDIKLINKPISVPIRYNAYYKLVLLLAIIEHCAMGKQASLQLIHFVFWGLRSEDNYKIVYDFSKKIRETLPPWSFEEGIDKILILSYINQYCKKKLVKNTDTLEVEITENGEKVIAEIKKLELFKEDFDKIKALSKIARSRLDKANQQWIIF